ncbi:MAG: sigma 54-interacting transcriptional regulator [bacterium]|nr:sigma 54-interacting transcriptional regulator [bacterium]
MNDREEPESIVRLREERDAYRLERDLYRRLLDLNRQTELEPLLREALALIVEVARARQGYLELQPEHGPGWSIAHGFTPEAVDAVRARVSQGIIAMALTGGRTILTSSALRDERFSGRESVLSGQIEAVLCAPIGEEAPMGVLYLQGRDVPESFSAEDQERAETFARHFALCAHRLLAERRPAEADPLARLRQTLRLEGVVGRSEALVAVLQQAALLAPLEVTILLTGDNGTGKTQLARVVHDSSPRAGQPFVEVNCAALPETLIESELFGALPGAHSTALRRITGRVAAAERGTLLLDEIGELSPSAQAKLLQLLQSKQYTPLGSARTVQADVRVIAASNTDLAAAVASRRFREDLFYRLQVMPLRMPSLAERLEDVPDLVSAFCATAARRHGLGRMRMSDGAIRAAQAAEWPGNVRQLAHAVEAAMIRAAGEGVLEIQRRHLFPPANGRGADGGQSETFQEATRRFQARLLRDTLEDTGWNVMEAARRLDLKKSNIYQMIKAFGLGRDKP